MKIKEDDKKEIKEHIKRRVRAFGLFNICMKKYVYRDMIAQIKREFGISCISALDRKYLYEIHEFIDCYELPLCIYKAVEK